MEFAVQSWGMLSRGGLESVAGMNELEDLQYGDLNGIVQSEWSCSSKYIITYRIYKDTLLYKNI